MAPKSQQQIVDNFGSFDWLFASNAPLQSSGNSKQKEEGWDRREGRRRGGRRRGEKERGVRANDILSLFQTQRRKHMRKKSVRQLLRQSRDWKPRRSYKGKMRRQPKCSKQTKVLTPSFLLLSPSPSIILPLPPPSISVLSFDSTFIPCL